MTMHHKNIKRQVVKKLKEEFPHWNRLKAKEKKEITNKVLNEVVAMYDFNQEIDCGKHELFGIEEQVHNEEILTIDKMNNFIEEHKSNNLLRLIGGNKENPHFACDELSFIDSIIDNQIIDALLSYEGYSPQMRDLFPHHLFRAEMLKTLKYPEISYRKFCTKEYFGMHQKENKCFIGFPLHKNKIIDHTVLSKFRSGLQFHQLVNILVYIICIFRNSGFINDNILYGIDSTDITAVNQRYLAQIEVNGTKIRIYDDLNCDCGKRRNKRDKSYYVIGYRLHTLTAINPESGHSYPLLPLLAPANHHDSLFAHPIISLAKAIGLNIKLVTADEAYHDKDSEIFNDTGASIITPPVKKVNIPEYVDIELKQVFCSKYCSTPMQYLGVYENLHEFKCAAQWGECPFAGSCPQARYIEIDSGHFQRISIFHEQAQEAIDIRKNSERPFNLLKNVYGASQARARSQHGILVQCTFAHAAALLVEMAGTRRKVTPSYTKEQQLPLPMAA
ncbi:MAG: hypothetical protein U5L00_11255 [Desulfovermiculus sp.]|nr:hypothetical protein [Desulfovermiculus sp.]